MLLNPADRDPAARGRLIGVLATLAILWPLFQAAEVKPSALFEAGNLKVITNFLAGFLPPEAGRNSSVTSPRRRWKRWPSPPPAWRWPV